jgi:hypothetical protein
MSRQSCQQAAAFHPDFLRRGKQDFYHGLRLAAKESKHFRLVSLGEG